MVFGTWKLTGALLFGTTRVWKNRIIQLRLLISIILSMEVLKTEQDPLFSNTNIGTEIYNIGLPSKND